MPLDFQEEEEELIPDGGLPRYPSSSLTSNLLSVDEGREMAVAVDEEVERMKMLDVKENMEERAGPLPRKPPPSWEEWNVASSTRAKGGKEVRVEFKLTNLR